MTRPAKGTPEYDLWVAAIEVAIYPPLVFKGATTQVSCRRIEELRTALDAVGIDWRAAKITDDATRSENARRQAEERRTEARAANAAREGTDEVLQDQQH